MRRKRKDRKTIPLKILVPATAVLFAMMIIIILIQSIKGTMSASFAAIWTFIVIIILECPICVSLYNSAVKKEKMYRQKISLIQKDLAGEKKKTAKTNTMLSVLQKKNNDLKREVSTYINQLNDINKEHNIYKQTLKQIYMSSKLYETREYAQECWKHMYSLDLYQPLRYFLDQKYAMVIDVNASELTEIFHECTDDTYGAEIVKINKVKTRLNELLKKEGTGEAGSCVQITVTEKKHIKKIEKDDKEEK